ncbi:MAG: MoaD/ThiS family protein [Gammaproteobacteria bacterium]|nr:MoaD/ThiS family protein [Gammaproteobacteria bacterium]MDE0645680.1 MoaD/ThiS family protein [Gammaproteobacteria bacterium]MXX94206.1 MoaD/ThiS family protein [Gammaproteobacteria bacterium]MYF52328.1 MoaD/ThiS family protein [Gammaproteobacteria bacterium]MYK42843.1 MoaD/ThiS family protein [Gammaproteobacteria bacterium]
MSSTEGLVKVLFFGAIREAVGVGEVAVEIPADRSLRTAVAMVMQEYGVKLTQYHRESYVVALNKQICKNDALLEANDEIAIFPPVTGG